MKPIIFIVGPTASGKTGLAIELAQQFNGEIISADSRAVYKHMDIGTAKPSAAEQALVPHWGIDLVDPGERFTAADFKEYTLAKIADIQSRGKIPFVVGGTGLYVDAVLFDYEFSKPADPELRQLLEQKTTAELQAYCKNHNIALPENINNKRHLIRNIERGGKNNSRSATPIEGAIVVGISTESSALRERIERRTEHLLELGVVDEAKMLGKIYGWDNESMTGNIYPLIRQYLDGDISMDELKLKFVRADWQLAKRQMTWFRRNKFINWLPLAEAKEFVLKLLQKEQGND